MRSCLVVLMLAGGLTAANADIILKHEPPPHGLRPGQFVLVDDGRCHHGQVDRVTGGDNLGDHRGGQSRVHRCVPRP